MYTLKVFVMLNSFAPKSFPLKKKGEWGEFPKLSILNSLLYFSYRAKQAL